MRTPIPARAPVSAPAACPRACTAFGLISALSAGLLPAPVAAGGFTDGTWSGFYIGAHGGARWGDLDRTSMEANWGGHVGYGLQLDFLVLGIEADATLGGSETTGVLSPMFYWSNATNWTGSVRGRAGLAFDKLHVFATLGATYLNETTTLNRFGQIQSATSSTSGLVYGAGVEYRVLPKLDLRFEILRTDYTLSGQNWLTSPTTSIPGLRDLSAQDTIVRAGVSFRMN